MKARLKQHIEFHRFLVYEELHRVSCSATIHRFRTSDETAELLNTVTEEGWILQ